jgi:hypothetical protein
VGEDSLNRTHSSAGRVKGLAIPSSSVLFRVFRGKNGWDRTSSSYPLLRQYQKITNCPILTHPEIAICHILRLHPHPKPREGARAAVATTSAASSIKNETTGTLIVLMVFIVSNSEA